MIKLLLNPFFSPPGGGENGADSFLSPKALAGAAAFFQTHPAYEPTPLHTYPALARHCGLGAIYVKDESNRLGLDSFKALGGFYALARLMAERSGEGNRPLTFSELAEDSSRQADPPLTFATATDGNHGRGVAEAARAYGQQAVVFLPQGSQQCRVEAIRAAGAEARVTASNYDETVQQVFREAREQDWVVVQDTVFGEYHRIPRWIMQGYALIALELAEQLSAGKGPDPTHLLLQAGVGSFAASLVGCLAQYKDLPPLHFIILEPATAACFFYTASGQGEPRTVQGSLETIMAGLSCGEVSPLAWDILKPRTAAFLSLPDWIAARGVRVLRNPPGEDPAMRAGESGAVGPGLLSLLGHKELTSLREKLHLDSDSVVLTINTEGITDPALNRNLLWDGLYATPEKLTWLEEPGSTVTSHIECNSSGLVR